MDTISHGLWAILLVKGVFNKSKLFLTFLFGILPDVLTFGLFFIENIIFGARAIGTPVPENLPSYIPFLYEITHSLVLVFVVFLIIYLFKKKIYIWMLGWPLHILVDIPSHSKDFFPTPFLYPLSDFTIGGISWTNPYMFFSNWILLIILFGILYRKELKKFLIKSNQLKKPSNN